MSKFILVVLSTIIFYFIFIIYSDFHDFIQSIIKFKLEYLLPFFVLTFMGMFIIGIRQQFLFKTIGILIPFKKNMMLSLAGFSMELTPGGSGKLIKSIYLKEKYGYEISKSFPIFIVERFYDLLAITIIVLFTLVFLQKIEITIILSLVAVLIFLIYFTIHSKTFFNIVVKVFGKIKFLKKFIITLTESQKLFQQLTTKNNLLKNCFISIISFTFYAFAAYFIFLGFNIDLNIIFTTFIMFSSLLFGSLTLLPSGIGITEIGVVSLLVYERIPLSLATSIMIISRLSNLSFLTIVGLITTKLFLK